MPYKIISLNTDSIVHNSRKILLNEFIKDSLGDIFLLQETKLDEKIKLHIENFNVFRCDIRRGWGGVALLVKHTIPVRNVCCIRTPFHVIFADCKINNVWQKICSCYIPHGVINIHREFYEFFSKHPNTIFGGDFNSRHSSFGDISSNVYGNALVDSASNLNLKILNPSFPTCYASIHGSFIDKYIFYNNNIIASQIEGVPSFSDHSGISIQLPGESSCQDTPIAQKMFHLANVTNINKFLNRKIEFLNISTTSNLAFGDCERISDTINGFMNEAVDRFVPSNKFQQHKIVLSTATRALQGRAKALQRKLHRDRGLTPLFDKQKILTEIKLIKNMILNSVNFESSKFFMNNFNSIETNRDAFRVIKNFTGHKSKSQTTGALSLDAKKNQFISGNNNIANELANRFEANHLLTHNVLTSNKNSVELAAFNLRQLNTQIKFSNDIPANIISNQQLDSVNSKLPIEHRGLLTSAEEVSLIISSRPNKKSCGNDNMPYFIMKQFNFSIIVFLATFFNHIISLAYFPKNWRHAIITPIPKTGKDSTIIENWRPISQLTCLSKIFERIICTRLSKTISNLNIFQNQFGFLNGHSTEHALSRFQSNVIYGLNNNKITTAVLLDLRAAFDTIWHDGLIQKMISLGINHFIIKIIQSMLTDRTFAVKIGNTISNIKNMMAGVPQGSCLGPICFNLFLFNIPTNPFINLLQFADDTTLFITHNNPKSAQNRLNLYLVKLTNFFDSNKLSLNHNKTELINIMGFVRDTSPKLRRNAKKMKISINGHIVEPSNVVRLLGVRFQTNNRFINHVNTQLTKAKRAKFHISKILKNKYIPRNVKCTMYKLFIRPILTYASPVWCMPPSLSSHQMEKLRIFERACLKSAANIKRPIGTYKHVNIKKIYSQARCMRIDRFIAKNNTNFFQKIRQTNEDKFNMITNLASQGPYPNINHIHVLHENGQLILNDQLLLFHQRYNGNGSVYNTGQ